MRWGAEPSRSISSDLPDSHQRAGDCLNRFCGLRAAAGSAKATAQAVRLQSLDAHLARRCKEFFCLRILKASALLPNSFAQ